jgi:nickel transport protein
MPSTFLHLGLRACACAGLLAAATLAQAHNVWLEPEADGAYVVQFGGHEGALESFPAEKLKGVQAYDGRGRAIAVAVRAQPGGARVTPERKAALLAAHFDNGFFSRQGEGPMVNLPMDRNPGATSGVHALKFHKTIIEWGPIARQKLGQAFEIVATTRRAPHAGEPQQFQVLLDGQPRAGVRVSLGEKGEPVTTDGQGLATVVPRAGMNQLLAIVRLPVNGDARTTSLSYEYLLGFSAH